MFWFGAPHAKTNNEPCTFGSRWSMPLQQMGACALPPFDTQPMKVSQGVLFEMSDCSAYLRAAG